MDKSWTEKWMKDIVYKLSLRMTFEEWINQYNYKERCSQEYLMLLEKLWNKYKAK